MTHAPVRYLAKELDKIIKKDFGSSVTKKELQSFLDGWIYAQIDDQIHTTLKYHKW